MFLACTLSHRCKSTSTNSYLLATTYQKTHSSSAGHMANQVSPLQGMYYFDQERDGVPGIPVQSKPFNPAHTPLSFSASFHRPLYVYLSLSLSLSLSLWLSLSLFLSLNLSTPLCLILSLSVSLSLWLSISLFLSLSMSLFYPISQ